jgi:type IV pilus assembly protein PilB
MRPLSDILLEAGMVTEAQLAAAQQEHERAGRSLGRVLVESHVLDEAQLVAALALQLGLPFVDLRDVGVDPEAVKLVPPTVCRRHLVLPIGFDDGRLVLAMADPANVFALDDVRSLSGLEPRPVVVTREDLLAAIDRYARGGLEHLRSAATSSVLQAAQAEGGDLSRLGSVVEDAPIVRYVNLLITQAIGDGASDIHIEPGEHDMRVRYRIDGVLHDVMRSPRSIVSAVVSRVKIMSELDIAEKRRPQDGRLSVEARSGQVDLRVATLPTVWGEKVVMRVLDNDTARLDLSELGFSDDNYRRFAESYSKPHGMILVTGPTGSGKSTTLYATLNMVNRPEINTITVEDPVEYRLPGINQVQVDVKAGLTFAAALRSILRSDPDVVLIGEIRDQETAKIAVEAALTGHLVLSTLHTNDAPSAVTRLIEMGVEPFMVASALETVLAQRLARRLCSKCKEPYEPDAEEVAFAGAAWPIREDEPHVAYRPAGCSACAKTGYKGRIALHEVMTVDERIERLAVARSSPTELGRAAREKGMTRLREDGLRKVLRGVTSLEEILRVVA